VGEGRNGDPVDAAVARVVNIILTRSSLLVLTAAVTALAMVATPLAEQGGDVRVVLSSVVVVGYFLVSFLAVDREWGTNRALRAAGAVVGLTLVVEFVGSTTGFPFGDYDYTTLLQPQIAGVPVIVPLAWWGMGLAAREVATAVLGGGSLFARVVLGAVALTAWDAFLDPQMVGEGYWVWANEGAYRGIPMSNYAGWMASSMAVMVLLEWLLPVRRAQRVPVVMYAFVAVMETIAFLFFFDDAVVALVGGIVMLPLSVLALRRVFGGRHG
jgi:putative membrane protein